MNTGCILGPGVRVSAGMVVPANSLYSALRPEELDVSEDDESGTASILACSAMFGYVRCPTLGSVAMDISLRGGH